MRRLQFIELEDLPWFPAVIRDGGTDWLAFMFGVSGAFNAAIPTIRTAMAAADTHVIVDLCSGAGGPWRSLGPALAKHGPVRVVLTDLYPNVRAFTAVRAEAPEVDFHPQPVDATSVPASLQGVRTMFNAFHHFPFSKAAAVLGDAVAAGQPVAIFEGAGTRALALVAMPMQIPLLLLLTPFVRPFRWSRLLFTYLIPLIPLLVLFDGTVSFLRLYSREELREVIAAAPCSEQFKWEIGSAKVPGLPVRLGYLLGVPAPGPAS